MVVAKRRGRCLGSGPLGSAAAAGIAKITALHQMREALLATAGTPVVQVGERRSRTLADLGERVQAPLARLCQHPLMGSVDELDSFDELPREQAAEQGIERLYRLVDVADGFGKGLIVLLRLHTASVEVGCSVAFVSLI
jgi:hypothetical protein